ncbi:MAG: hypothetical protein Q9218_005133 [Villophora microphyllina]
MTPEIDRACVSPIPSSRTASHEQLAQPTDAQHQLAHHRSPRVSQLGANLSSQGQVARETCQNTRNEDPSQVHLHHPRMPPFSRTKRDGSVYNGDVDGQTQRKHHVLNFARRRKDTNIHHLPADVAAQWEDGHAICLVAK